MKLRHLSTLKKSCCALALSIITTPYPAHADTQSDEWWLGDWTCDLRGHPAHMKWSTVEDEQTTVGTDEAAGHTSAPRWEGSFSEDGAKWVALTEPRLGKNGGLYFRHADGHKWYFQKPVANEIKGWTRLAPQRNAPRYPISCWRS
ncbi:hypothetical protein D3C78_1414790 [compost metagenome]